MPDRVAIASRCHLCGLPVVLPGARWADLAHTACCLVCDDCLDLLERGGAQAVDPLVGDGESHA